MRRVRVSIRNRPRPVDVEIKEGLFHQWGLDTHTSDEDDIGTFTIAIIELNDGKIITASPDDVQFVPEVGEPPLHKM